MLAALAALATAAVLEPEVDESVREKRSDDVYTASLRTLVEQHASVIQTLQADLTAHNDRVKTLETSLQALQNRVERTSKTGKFHDVVIACRWWLVVVLMSMRV